MIMVDATKEKYRFQSTPTTARARLSLAIKSFPREGRFKMTLEGQVKTQPEINRGQLGELRNENKGENGHKGGNKASFWANK